MSIIQRQADDFLRYQLNEHGDYKEFIGEVQSQLDNYKKIPHKISFVEHLIAQIKIEFDNHLKKCTEKEGCHIYKFFENSLFFLQEEMEELEGYLNQNEFTQIEKKDISKTLESIANDLAIIKVSSEFTYNDLLKEIEELKDFYFLDKKSWKQLFTGKLTEMVAGGIISETISKDLIALIEKHYTDIVS